MHADLIFKRLYYDFPEEDIGRFFRNRARQDGDNPGGPSEAVDEQTGDPGSKKSAKKKKAAPKLGRDRIACNLLGVSYEEVSDWKAFYDTEKIPWRRVYTDYFVPLARLCRLMHRSFTTRSFDQQLFEAAKEYTKGCREVLGKEYMRSKGLWHRLFHVIAQALGEPSVRGTKCA